MALHAEVDRQTVGAGLGPASARAPSAPVRRRHSLRLLSEIVRAFKSFSSRRINARRRAPGTAVWQRGYHEHIVRRDESLDHIRAYIATNPLRWHLDKENPAHAERR